MHDGSVHLENVAVIEVFTEERHYFETGLSLPKPKCILVEASSPYARDVLNYSYRNSSIVYFYGAKWVVFKVDNNRFCMNQVRVVQ